MKIAEREVTIFLDKEGHDVMALASVNMQQPIYVQIPMILEFGLELIALTANMLF